MRSKILKVNKIKRGERIKMEAKVQRKKLNSNAKHYKQELV